MTCTHSVSEAAEVHDPVRANVPPIWNRVHRGEGGDGFTATPLAGCGVCKLRRFGADTPDWTWQPEGHSVQRLVAAALSRQIALDVEADVSSEPVAAQTPCALLPRRSHAVGPLTR